MEADGGHGGKLDSYLSVFLEATYSAFLVPIQVNYEEDEPELASDEDELRKLNEEMTSNQVYRQRIDALKRLQRSFEVAVRTNASNPASFLVGLIKQNCLLIWNLSLPLLQVIRHTLLYLSYKHALIDL